MSSNIITIFRRDSEVLTELDRVIITKENVLNALWEKGEYDLYGERYEWIDIMIVRNEYSMYIYGINGTRTEESETFIDIMLSDAEYNYLILKSS